MEVSANGHHSVSANDDDIGYAAGKYAARLNPNLGGGSLTLAANYWYSRATESMNLDKVAYFCGFYEGYRDQASRMREEN
ncbi:MAG TPA: hypothetical protein VF043_07770 [Ktedonobacteraceae bacterium]